MSWPPARTRSTGDYLSGRLSIPVPAQRRPGNGESLTIRGARAHNLKNVTVKLPLGTLIAVTGVSGSGKSSLMFDILDRAARQRFYGASDLPGEHDAIEGWEHLDKIVTIDQTAIGRTPRSNAATYTDAFTPIREAFAATPEARQRRTDRPALFVQRAGRPLRAMRGRGRADRGDALFARRAGALPGLSRAALQARGAGGAVSRLRHCPGARPDDRGSACHSSRMCRRRPPGSR